MHMFWVSFFLGMGGEDVQAETCIPLNQSVAEPYISATRKMPNDELTISMSETILNMQESRSSYALQQPEVSNRLRSIRLNEGIRYLIGPIRWSNKHHCCPSANLDHDII